MNNYGLKDRVIAITGGASGIGRAAALALAKDGAKIGIIDMNADAIDTVLEEIRAIGAAASGFALDVRDSAAQAHAAEQFESELGPVTGLIACAGTGRAAPAEAMTDDEFSAVMSVNVDGVFNSAREFGKRMIAAGGGSIVLIGSVDSLGGHSGRANYSASKHAVIGLTKTFAIEWGRHGVRVNSVAPGFVDTPLLRASMPSSFSENILDRTPLGRMASAEEIAKTCLMLLSESASYVTGANLSVDGGLTAGFFTKKRGGDYASNKLLSDGVYSE